MKETISILHKFKWPVDFDIEGTIQYYRSLEPKHTTTDLLSLIYTYLVHYLRPHITKHKTTFLFDLPNHTKYKQAKPYVDLIESDKMSFLFLNIKNKRTEVLYEELRESKFIVFHNGLNLSILLYILLNIPSLLWVLLTSRYKKTLEIYSIFFTAIFYASLYTNIFKSTSCNFFITANEDFWLSALINQIAKKNNIKTINFMHGRGYKNNQYYDYSFIYSARQKKWLKKNTRSKTHYVVSGNVDSSTNNSSKIQYMNGKNILVFDQPEFSLLSKQNRNDFYSVIQSFHKENSDYKILIKEHPSVPFKLTCLKSDQYTILPKNINFTDSLTDVRFALTICSTASIEAISNGVYTVHYNPSKLLSEFSQIDFFTDLSPTTPKDLHTLIHNLADDDYLLESYFTKVKEIIHSDSSHHTPYSELFNQYFF
jgi:hypothetical protein